MIFYYPTALRRVQNNTQNKYKNITQYSYSRGPVRQVCLLLTNELAGFPVPILFRFAHFCRVFPARQINIHEIRPHGHKNLACWITNLLLDVCCIVSLRMFTQVGCILTCPTDLSTYKTSNKIRIYILSFQHTCTM